ncbi:HD domain-containing protein [Nocardioides sp. CPCC 205120]|uniref:HD domain-containing protein n=1 Tax=Nocardioides sp. CPCC 205120 TaxID=3406462 RepID=UPI003B50595F
MWVEEMDTERFAAAVGLAAHLHRGQVRKGTQVPYVSHLLSVAALVAEDGGTEDQVIAGLLHDAAEDQGGEATLTVIAERFGAGVAELVRACSDSIDEAGAEKAPWKERKEAAIAHVADVPAEALLVLAADKLHNTRSTEADRAFHGSGVWTRFKAGRDGFLWYHLAELLVLEERVPESRSVRLLRRELSGLACGEAAGSPLATVANVPEEVRPFFAAGLLEEGWPGWGFGAGPEQDAFVAGHQVTSLCGLVQSADLADYKSDARRYDAHADTVNERYGARVVERVDEWVWG